MRLPGETARYGAVIAEPETDDPATPAGVAHDPLAVVLLGVATGASDAFSFLTGRVFASVMTGNLVLLGLSAAGRDGSLAVHAGLSLVGYVVGTAIGSRACRPAPGWRWPPGTLPVLALEAGLLSAVALVRLLVSGALPVALEVALLVVTAAAMGLQSAVARAALALPRSTTYLTGALTGVVASVVSGQGIGQERSTVILLGSAVLGAGAQGALVLYVARAGPVLSAAAVVGALLLAAGAREPALGPSAG